MRTPTKKYDNKKQRVKLMLMAGRKLTKRYLDRVLDVTNSGEIIRQLRKEIDIDTVWKISREGTRYGEYVYKAPPVESRIENQSYREFATLKRNR